MARVVLENLIKTYPDKSGEVVPAVNGINLAIEDKEFMVLVGPSGCGKTTTLRMIAGLEEITSGTILIDGLPMNSVPPKDRDIAMVFQNYALYPHMSVFENLAFGLRMRNVPKASIDSCVRDAAAILGLEPYLNRRPSALSGGQRQRVALGRAIVRKPKVFLFDEPLSNLDAKMRVSTRAEIARLRTRLGATMIYVTHDQVEAMTMGDRICVIKDGNVQQVADPLELYNRPANAFVAGFIGSPPMNLFKGSLGRMEGGLSFTEAGSPAHPLQLTVPEFQAGPLIPFLQNSLLVGIRPEHISHVPEADSQPVDASVEIAESMGSETLLHLTTGGSPFIAKIPPGPRFVPGEETRVYFRTGRLHFFDEQSGRAL